MTGWHRASSLGVALATAAMLCHEAVDAGSSDGRPRVHAHSIQQTGKGQEQVERATSIPGVRLAAEKTVVMVLASECDACWKSLEFYRTVLAASGMDGKRKRLVVLASDGVWPVGNLLDKQRFKPHALVSYPTLTNPVELPNKAPSILVLDGDGKKMGLWVGQLDSIQEKEVLAAIGTN